MSNKPLPAQSPAGYLTPVKPGDANENNMGNKKHGRGVLSNTFNWARRNTVKLIKLGALAAIFGPAVLGLQQCTVNTDYNFYEYEAMKYASITAAAAYKAEGEFIRGAAKTVMYPTIGLFGPVEGHKKDNITYGSTPYVQVCIPTTLQIDVKNNNPEALEYYSSVLNQIDRRIRSLNNPQDIMRQGHPNKDFVIIAHKKPSDYDRASAHNGLQRLISTIAVDPPANTMCPPSEVKQKQHENYRQEFVTTTYDGSLRYVPGLKPPQ